MTDLALALGTRPEIIKLSPVIRECQHRDVAYTLIHTGQHYSENLDAVFFDQLELPEPDVNLRVGSNTHGTQTAEMIAGIEEVLLEETPHTLLVQGDTNSVLAGAIAASKLDVDLGHVEAGLRSFDDAMPEETNRVLTDHAADYLFAPTEESARLLADEGLEDDVYVTGNTVVDAVQQNISLAREKSDVLSRLDLEPNSYAVLTAHREENVDDEATLRDLLAGVGRVADRFGIDVVYPVHPRTTDRIEAFGVQVPDAVRLVDPLDYLDFLALQQHASLILTDSGGVQEEACILGVPCVTLRENTERPETLTVGANELAGTDPDRIVATAETMADAGSWSNPFGDGEAAGRILETILTEPTTLPP